MRDAPNRAIRLIQLTIILSYGEHRALDLATRLGVSKRTIERDLVDLQTAPLYCPLICDKWRWRWLRE